MERLSLITEKKLLDAAMSGDETAFTSLVTFYRPRIYHLCYGFVYDQELAEDLAQETFLHAFEHLKEFRGESKFYTWLYAIAKNCSLNMLKKREREKKKEKKIKENYDKHFLKFFVRPDENIKISKLPLKLNCNSSQRIIKPFLGSMFLRESLTGKLQKC